MTNANQPAAEVRSLAPPLVRMEFSIETSPQDIEPYLDSYAQQGVRVLLLAGFYRRLPSEAEARGLGRWAAAFGPGSGRPLPVTAIEFGNETSYGDQYGNDRPSDTSYVRRASAYARLAKLAADAVHTADVGVGLLAQADDGNTGSSAWVDAMFAAEPDLDARVVGWTIHPYGPSYATRLARARGQLARHGAHRSLWVTEWGVASDSGRCLHDNSGWNRCMNDTDAANALLQVTAVLHKYDVAVFLVYQVKDQRPPGTDNDSQHYYGILQSTGRPKGRYTQAVRALWAG